MGSDGATQARRIIHEAAPELTALSEAIHASAELGFQEHDSMKRCVDLLKARGFTITTPLCGLDTAFDAFQRDQAAEAETPDQCVGLVESDFRENRHRALRT